MRINMSRKHKDKKPNQELYYEDVEIEENEDTEDTDEIKETEEVAEVEGSEEVEFEDETENVENEDDVVYVNNEFEDEDLEVIDLEKEDGYNSELVEEKSGKSKFIHIGFAALVVIVIASMALVIHKWNMGKELEFTESDLAKQKEGYWDTESLDFPIFFDPAKDEGYVDDGNLNIIILGDESAGNVDDSTTFAGKIKEKTGANVMTATYEGMTFSISDKSYTTDHPEDAFSMYYFVTCLVNNDFYLQEQALEQMDEKTAQKYSDFFYWARYLDYASADVIIISCGRHDYLKGRCITGTDVYSEQQFGTPDSISGGMDASVKMLKAAYPNAQIIVSSPTFFITEDKDGNDIGADLMNNGYGGLGEYIANMANVSMEESVTFVDNYFGIAFNSTNYEGYLKEDGKTVTEETAKILADHVEQYFYYNL